MARRTPQQWDTLIQEHAASGQTATAFCAARGINDKYFSLQKTKRRSKTLKPSTAHSPFVTLKALAQPQPSHKTLSLHYKAVIINFPPETPTQWLATLIRELA